MIPEVIFADKDLIVINKPPGMTVHPVKNFGGISEKTGGGNAPLVPTLVDFLLEKFPEIASVGDEPAVRPGIVHRLDKDTSGVMLVARNQETFYTLKSIFKNRLAEKIYHAIVCGALKTRGGTVALPIGRIARNPTRRGVEFGKTKIRGARDAITKYRVLKENPAYSLVELKPQTGRMHQLRVHMKALGRPVACDRTYGGKKVCCPEEAGRQMLHAKSISFSLTTGKRLFFEADYPADFALAVRKIM